MTGPVRPEISDDWWQEPFLHRARLAGDPFDIALYALDRLGTRFSYAVDPGRGGGVMSCDDPEVLAHLARMFPADMT